jgi:hypothetical protein
LRTSPKPSVTQFEGLHRQELSHARRAKHHDGFVDLNIGLDAQPVKASCHGAILAAKWIIHFMAMALLEAIDAASALGKRVSQVSIARHVKILL